MNNEDKDETIGVECIQQDVINLSKAGVSEKVISAMMQQPSEPSSQSSSPDIVRYYVYPPYFWYDGFYTD
jgi:hypothetical protein